MTKLSPAAHWSNSMTDQQHLITPPPELVQQWWKDAQQADHSDGLPCWLNYVATQAAQWGADQELEACEKYWMTHGISPEGVVRMREHRRPKPPSLKEQALTALSHLLSGSAQTLDTTEAEFYIRRALEALPND